MSIENKWVYGSENETSLSPIALEELHHLSSNLLQDIQEMDNLDDELKHLPQDSSKILGSIQKLKEKITTEVKSLKSLINEGKNYYSNHKDEKEFQKIKQQFEEILKFYESTNKKISTKPKKQQIKKDEKENLEIEESIIQMKELKRELNLKTSDLKRLEIETAIQMEKERDLKKLEEDMKELTSNYQNLDDLVKEQGEALLSSSQQVENSSLYVQGSVKSLKDANKKQGSNKCKLILLIILVFLILIGSGVVLFFAFLPK